MGTPTYTRVPPQAGLSPDIVAIGGTLDVPTLQSAYQQGFFPWPTDDHDPLLWFSPMERGVLYLDELHLPRSLRRTLRRQRFTVVTDTRFEEVISACQRQPRPNQKGTWITNAIIEGYIKLHQAGIAHSVEVLIDGELAAGLYGVRVGNSFSGESMFHRQSNGSKLALLGLMAILGQLNTPFLDTQMVTPVVAQLGGKTICREDFLHQWLSLSQMTVPPPWPSKTRFTAKTILDNFCIKY